MNPHVLGRICHTFAHDTHASSVRCPLPKTAHPFLAHVAHVPSSDDMRATFIAIAMDRRRGPRILAATTLAPIRTLTFSDAGIAQCFDPGTNAVKGLDPAQMASKHSNNFSTIVAERGIASVGNPDQSRTYYIPFSTPTLIFPAGALRTLTHNSDCYVATVNRDADDDTVDTDTAAPRATIDAVKLAMAVLIVGMVAAILYLTFG